MVSSLGCDPSRHDRFGLDSSTWFFSPSETIRVQCNAYWYGARLQTWWPRMYSCHVTLLLSLTERQRLPWRPLLTRHPILNDTMPVRLLPRVSLAILPRRLRLRCEPPPRQDRFLFLATTVGNDEHQTLDPIPIGIMDRTSTTSKKCTTCHQPTSSLTTATSP